MVNSSLNLSQMPKDNTLNISNTITQPNATVQTNTTPQSKTAFVFSGGGSLASFEIGAANYLMNIKKILPGIICGTSAGSIVGAKLAEGGDACNQLVKTWSNINTYSTVFELRPEVNTLLHEIPSIQQSFNELLPGLINPMPLSFIIPLIETGVSASNIVDAIKKLSQLPSLLTTSGLRNFLSSNIDKNKILNSNIKFKAFSVGLESGQLFYMNEKSEFYKISDPAKPDGDKLGTNDLINGLMASSAIPVVLPPAGMFNETLVDGGVREMIPIRSACSMGATDVYVIYTGPQITQAPSFGKANLIDIGTRSLDILTDEGTTNDLPSKNDFPNIKFLKIRPSIKLHNSLTFDLGLTQIAMDYGMMTAADELLLQTKGFYTGDGVLGGLANMGLAVLYQTLKNTRDEITRLRYEAWNLEYIENDMPSCDWDTAINPFNIRPISSNSSTNSRTRPVITQQDLDNIRNKKAGIRENIKLRLKMQDTAFLPANYTSWYQGWETHSCFKPTNNLWNKPADAENFFYDKNS